MENYYGFTPGKSTVDALSRLCEIFRYANDYTCKKKVGMPALGVKNTFNLTPWQKILDALQFK